MDVVKRKHSVMRWLMSLTVVLGLSIGLCTIGYARPPEETEFTAAASLGEDIAHWISDLKPTPRSVAIYTVHVNEPIDPSFTSIIENDILTSLVHRGISKATTCQECKSAQVTVNGDEVVIAKGTPDIDTLKAIGKKLPVESFLLVEVYRTALAVVGQATLYSNENGELLGAENFRVPALKYSDASVQVLLTLGSGKALYSGATSSSTSTSSSSGITTAGNILLLEELGFAKGGLNLGGILAPGNTLIYLNPTLSLRGHFGSYSMGWALNLGLGYGFMSSYRGISTRAAFEIFLGSLAVLGAEGVYFFPSNSTSTGSQYLTGYVGMHIGLAFGR